MNREYTGERFLPEECRGEIAAEHYQRYQFAKQFVKENRSGRSLRRRVRQQPSGRRGGRGYWL